MWPLGTIIGAAMIIAGVFFIIASNQASIIRCSPPPNEGCPLPTGYNLRVWSYLISGIVAIISGACVLAWNFIGLVTFFYREKN